VGDGNVHFNLSQPVGSEREAFLARRNEIGEIVHGIAASMGGSISAEHGVGLLKKDELPLFKSDIEMELMRKLKHCLDPNSLMNPGKVV